MVGLWVLSVFPFCLFVFIRFVLSLSKCVYEGGCPEDTLPVLRCLCSSEVRNSEQGAWNRHFSEKRGAVHQLIGNLLWASWNLLTAERAALPCSCWNLSSARSVSE